MSTEMYTNRLKRAQKEPVEKPVENVEKLWLSTAIIRICKLAVRLVLYA